jgi:hypothetical protein
MQSRSRRRISEPQALEEPGSEKVLATLGLVSTAAAFLSLVAVPLFGAVGLSGNADAPGWQRLLQGVIYLASMPPLALVGSVLCLAAIVMGRRRGAGGWRRAALGLGLGIVMLIYWLSLIIWAMAFQGS